MLQRGPSTMSSLSPRMTTLNHTETCLLEYDAADNDRAGRNIVAAAAQLDLSGAQAVDHGCELWK